ncbi:PAAR domain-containing protein [Luteimonas yindakuii]|uniref:PAAR domain-containing protein n=1 Tax=Luteimonas yindakuii TaxID=2565782 RepID=UPI00110770EE|nr:PAAR domain-containing protein [Luteimonas yindakuii]QCO66683.2 PAAR domain-containing protein [Luteimonas yindakuii]
MAKPIVCVGDALDHGGSVVSGSPFTDIDGRPVARVGDRVVCSRHGPTAIVSGDSTLIVDGQPIARHGDRAACGAMLISSQVHAFVEQNPQSDRDSSRSCAAGPRAASASLASMAFDRTFVLCNSASGQPLPNTPYRIKLSDGRSIGGVSDERGSTVRVTGATALDAVIEVLA